MKIRGHGNGVAIALSAIAVVFAASGTAYAVTATTVNIADPSAPARVAKVDAAGRLSTAGATSTLDIVSTAYTNASGNLDLFSAPTTATLAVSKISVVPSAPISSPYNVYLFQVPVNTDGTCSVNITSRTLAYSAVSPGGTGGQDYAAPLVVTALGNARYCLDLYVLQSSGAAVQSVAFGVQITGYVVGGKYAGVGLPPATAGAAQSKAAAVKGH